MVTTTTYTTPWTPTTPEAYDALKGRDVVSADHEQLGTIAAIFHPTPAIPEARGEPYVLVKPGLLKRWFDDGSAFYVPASAIARVTDDAVRLLYATDQLEIHGWDQPPAELAEFHRA